MRDPEAVRRAKAKWRAKNPDYKDKWRKANPDAENESHRARKYGMPLWVWRALITYKPSACEICGNEAHLCYDHCHDSGRFRGWICDRCNTGLGHFRNDPGRLRSAASYLEERSA